MRQPSTKIKMNSNEKATSADGFLIPSEPAQRAGDATTAGSSVCDCSAPRVVIPGPGVDYASGSCDTYDGGGELEALA
jgi:hypothetical protein